MLTAEPNPNAVAFHELAGLSPAARNRLMQRTEGDMTKFLQGAAPIIEAVRTEADAALVRFAEAFDGAKITEATIAATPAEMDAAFDQLDRPLITAMEYAADNIRRFHEAQMPSQMWMKEIRPGVLVGERVSPIDSAALYSPRGKGSFPSMTLMTAIPAVVAGVPRPVILTPAGPDGQIDPATLVAARLAGVSDVFKAGGAVAVAAAAFGTRTVPRCCVFEGPGSPWVIAAKRLLQHHIGSSVSAGPSESIVLADDSLDPRLIALDLLIESEHGSDSSTFLVTWSRSTALAVQQAVPGLWAKMSAQRRRFSADVLCGEKGGIILTDSPAAAYDFINAYAPEHLQIMTKAPFDHLPFIRNAGEILLGEHAPSSVANYMMGPNAVLPTAGAAKYSSALGVHTFLKSSSLAHLTASGLREMAPHTHRFATYEGFDAHANAVAPGARG